MVARAWTWGGAIGLAALLLFGIGALAAVPSTRVIGSVVDAKGKPLADVAVGILLSDAVAALRKAQPSFALATRTDVAGRFQLSLPQSLGQVTLVAQRTGLLSTEAQTQLRVEQRELPPLRLLTGLTLSGRVTDEAGRPLAAVNISGSCWPQQDSTVGPLHRFSARTGRDGSFVQTGLERGSYRLRAELAGYGSWRDQFVSIEEAAKTRRLQITLRPAAYLSGVVTDPGGRPLSGARLSEAGEDPRIVTITDGAGRFRLGPFPAESEAYVAVSLRGYATLQQSFKTPQNDVQLVLARTGVLRGRVVDAANGTPLEEFQIGFQSRRVAPDSAVEYPAPRPVTTPDGRFELPDVAPGPWAITALARGYVPRELQGVEVMPGGATPELLIELQRGIVLRGRVIDKANGKPLKDVRISYGDPLESRVRASSGSGHGAATTDAQGSFVLQGLPAGTMTINAESYEHLAASRRIALVQDSSVEFAWVEFALSRGASIAGQVVAADGVTPVEGWLSVTGEKGSLGASTDAAGRFDLQHQAAGRYRIRAQGSNAGMKSQVSAWQEVIVTEDQQLDAIKLVLQAAPAIHGAVAGLSPAELQQLRVAQVPAQKNTEGKWLWHGNLFNESSFGVEIDAANYRTERSEPGPTIIIAGPVQGPQIHKRIVVPQRGAVGLDFDFAGGMRVSGRVTRAGKPAVGIAMWALPDAVQPVAGFTKTDANGEYRFADLASGGYRVGPVNIKFTRLQMTGNVVQDFELPALEVVGRAVDATTGRPLGSVQVELRAAQSDAVTERRAAVTDREGSFKLEQLAPGDYVLTLQRAGYAMIRQDIVLRSSLDALSLQLRAAEGVRLQVRGPDVGEVAEATLFERSGEVVVAVVPVPLDASGMGKLPASLAGRTFTISVAGYEPFIVSTWDGGPLEVALRKSRRQ